ncbi:PepSY-associated TM helix domain-containing protein [Edaphobacter bradus]|uniref:PepSY-associated TM helix domain-containing protein n=1 Tax=Edaphobacter bradus TaxID=2259016 RepID=UPI0021E0CD3B|nr:PepSY-associated TM helix domain-containing protein [Edaphobacter bradus]
MKKLVLNLHLCVGVIAALFLISLSITGAIIAFENELNRAVHPQLTNVRPEGQPLDWDSVRARVEQQAPGWKLIRFYFPDRSDRSTYVRLRSSTTHRIRHVYVNQYTGAILGSTEDGSNWILKVHDLHVNLLSGKIGNRIVTWSTFGLLLLSLSGIILWWPRKVFRFQRTPSLVRFNRDLHYSVGFWSFLAMFAFSITGLALHYQTGKLLNLLNTPATAASMPGHGTSIEGMLRTAREALPGSTIPRLLLPEKAGDPVFIYQRFPEDRTPAGRSFTTLDPKTGAVLSFGSTRTAPLLQTALVQWTREIHTGTILGFPTQIAASFFGLMLSVLAITGSVIWISKQWALARGRRALLRRDRAQALSGN